MIDNEIDPRFAELYEQAKDDLQLWPEVTHVKAEAHTVTVFHDGCLEVLFEYFDEIHDDAYIKAHAHGRFADDEVADAGARYHERFTLAFDD